MKELLELYVTMFRVGAVTFGGGMAMLPILQKELVENKGWTTNEEIIDSYALSQGLPGIIAVNVSVFIGYKRKKLLGGIAAALGVVSPCIVIITIIAACLSNFQNVIQVKQAFAGISVCVSALILNSVINLWKKGVVDLLGVIIFCIVFIGMLFTKISPVLYVIAAALIGIVVKRRGQKGQ